MSRVTEIRHVGYSVVDFDAERAIYKDDWGLVEVAEAGGLSWLINHGATDRQISVDYADDLYDQLVHSPSREKMIFTAREGGVEHVGADNMSYGRDLLSDWFAETLNG